MTQQALRRFRIVIGSLIVGLFGGAGWNISHAAMILGIVAGVVSSAVVDEIFD